jgi:cytochrome c oxidase subunit 2
MYYLTSHGARGQVMANMTWAVLTVAVIVVLVTSTLVLAGLWRRGSRYSQNGQMPAQIVRGQSGLIWVYAGLLVTTVVLIGLTVWTFNAMAAIGKPAREPRLTIDVTGHQWWWELEYSADDPGRAFKTANEIHIPVGEPVRLRLHSADVIHSFWVPALSGKTDLIPGQVNETWIEADRVGVYRGQCAEYCGKQHANMAMKVFADPPGEFLAWTQNQMARAQEFGGDLPQAGRTRLVPQCGVCHTVRGTMAGGTMGPDLSHPMSRTSMAANTPPNTPADFSAWIVAPQHSKPGAHMPATGISGTDLNAIRHFRMGLE